MATWEAVMSGSGGRVFLVLQVDIVSQNVPGNFTTLNWALRLEERVNSASYNLNHLYTGTANVDGQKWSASGLDYDFRPLSTGNYSLQSGTVDVVHSSDGVKTIFVGGSFNGSGSYGSASFLTTFSLPTIPRASVPSFGSNPSDIGVDVTIYTNRADSSFVHNVYYNFENNGWVGPFATDVETSVSWTPPLSLLDLIPNASSGNCQVSLDTWSGSTLVGTQISNLTLTVPTSVIPTFSTITHSEATTGLAALVGGYVQNVTTLNLAITSAAGVHSSTIASYKIEVAGQTINAVSGVSAAIATSGTVAVVGTITDSRGRQATQTVNITVLAYTRPSYSSSEIRRAVSGTGVVDPENGTAIRLDLVASVQSLVVGAVEKNALSYTVYIRLKGDSSWGTAVTVPAVTPATTLSGGRLNYTGYNYWSTYALTSAWEVQVLLTDKITAAVPVTGTVATASIFMHWGGSGEGLGINKFWEQGAVDVRGQIYQNTGQAVVDTAMQTTAIDAALTAYTAARTPRVISKFHAASSHNNGGTVDTLVIPSHALARRVLLSWVGMHGFSATSGINSALNPSVSAGTLTEEHMSGYLANGAQWLAYNWTGYLDLAAGVGSTLTLTAYVSTGNCYYNGLLRGDIYYPGEYA